jgi:hypothetical protein
MIPFSLTGTRHSTARLYAADANSRVLDEEHQKTLKAAAAGKEVDLRAFQKAVTQALSSAATRKGQSMARRDLTRKIRHLAYIADGALDAHLAEVSRGGNVTVVSQRDHETEQALQDARREVEAHRAALAGERETYQRSTADLRDKLSRANTSRIATEILHRRTVAMLEYARSIAGEVDRARIEAYGEGLRDGENG